MSTIDERISTSLLMDNQSLRAEIKRLADNEKKYIEIIKETNDNYIDLLNKIIAFAGELQSWGKSAAAEEILNELVARKVVAPNYYELQAECERLKGLLAEQGSKP